MKSLRTFDIHVFKLSVGKHDYQFKIDEKFFESFENGIVTKGKLICDIQLDKSETMIQMNFRINGQAELTCDRSLELFDHPLSFERKVIFKFGEEEKELSDEMMVIPRDTPLINVASLIFEFIHLEIPMKKLHPRFETTEGADDEGFLVYSSETEENESKPNESSEPTDPRWEALKKLK